MLRSYVCVASTEPFPIPACLLLSTCLPGILYSRQHVLFYGQSYSLLQVKVKEAKLQRKKGFGASARDPMSATIFFNQLFSFLGVWCHFSPLHCFLILVPSSRHYGKRPFVFLFLCPGGHCNPYEGKLCASLYLLFHFLCLTAQKANLLMCQVLL